MKRLIGISTHHLQAKYGDLRAMEIASEIGYTGAYNMEVNLVHFGEDFMIEEARFAIKALRHVLGARYGQL